MHTPPISLAYRRDIDGLRSLAVLPVILFHAGAQWMPGGFVGVDIFFVISGYLISSIILREVQAENFSFLRFYERRLRRIVPALVTMLIVAVTVFQIIGLPDQAQGAAESGIAALLSVSNIYFWQESGYFAPAVEYMPLLHTWSLGVEEQFYIFFPVLVLLIWRFRLPMRLVLMLGTLACFALGYWLSVAKPSLAYYLLPARAWELGIGGVIACGAISPLREGIMREVATITGVVLIVVSLFWIRSDMIFPGWVALLPCVGAALVLHSGGTSWSARHILGNNAMVFVGLLSYSLYLWHWPVMAALRVKGADIEMALPIATLSVILTFLFGYLSWRFVEMPFRDRRAKPAGPMLLSLGISSMLLLTLSAASIVQKGFPGRLNEAATRALAAARDIDPYREPCRDRSPDRDCRFGVLDGPVTKVVVGDSHAAAIRGGIETSGLLEDSGATMLWEGACPLLDGSIPTNHAERSRCLSFKDYAWETLVAMPEVDTVILGGRWPYQITGYLPESGGSHKVLFADDQSDEPGADMRRSKMPIPLSRSSPKTIPTGCARLSILTARWELA